MQFVRCVQVLVTDPGKLDAIRQRESDITKERIQKILNTGVNVVLTTGGIDDLCLKVWNHFCPLSFLFFNVSIFEYYSNVFWNSQRIIFLWLDYWISPKSKN